MVIQNEMYPVDSSSRVINFSAFPVAVACWMHSLISQWELLVNGDVCGHENGDVVAGMLDACMSISLLFC